MALVGRIPRLPAVSEILGGPIPLTVARCATALVSGSLARRSLFQVSGPRARTVEGCERSGERWPTGALLEHRRAAREQPGSLIRRGNRKGPQAGVVALTVGARARAEHASRSDVQPCRRGHAGVRAIPEGADRRHDLAGLSPPVFYPAPDSDDQIDMELWIRQLGPLMGH